MITLDHPFLLLKYKSWPAVLDAFMDFVYEHETLHGAIVFGTPEQLWHKFVSFETKEIDRKIEALEKALEAKRVQGA